MKYLLIALMMFLNIPYVNAQESCEVIKQDVNTPVPQELKDKEICIRDPKTKELDCKSANEYKVVKRKQQFKVKEITKPCEPTYIVKEVVRFEKAKENKNLLMLGVREDYIKLDKSVSGNSATVTKESGLIFDLSYFRRQMFDSNIGLGIGIDTNRTLRGMVGLEF